MNKKDAFTLVEIMIVVSIIGLLAALGIPSFMRARITTQRNACMNNLRQIDTAKHQWALETNQAADAIPEQADVAGYMKGGIQHAFCPADPGRSFASSYDILDMSQNPACQVVPDTHGLPIDVN